jgi:hypothetical protein
MNIHFKIKKYLHVADGTYMNPHTEIERRWQNKKTINNFSGEVGNR